MPNWTPLVMRALSEATSFLSIKDIRRKVVTFGPNRIAPPSAVCVKNILVCGIQIRTIVGMKGKFGAAYFALSTKVIIDGEWLPDWWQPPQTWDWRRHRQYSRFNDMVREAWREGRDLPLPFTVRERPTAPQPAVVSEVAPECVGGPIETLVTEPQSIPNWLTRGLRPGADIITATEGVRIPGRGTLHSLIAEGDLAHLTLDDVRSVLSTALGTLSTVIEQKKATMIPQTLVDEFKRRIPVLALEDDG